MGFNSNLKNGTKTGGRSRFWDSRDTLNLLQPWTTRDTGKQDAANSERSFDAGHSDISFFLFYFDRFRRIPLRQMLEIGRIAP